MKLSIIIVYYNNRKLLGECLDSIYDNSLNFGFEVVLVDNSRGLRLRKRYANLKYVKSPGNVGYGAGNNLGVRYSRGEYLLILNPDTRVLRGSIESLVEFLDKNEKAVVVAPNLVRPNLRVFSQLGTSELTPLRGIVALSFLNKFFPNNPISRKYWLKDVRMDELREVGVVPGSAFLIRKSVLEKVGGFDENFFLFFEESDFFKRVKEVFPKLKIYINPKSQIIHHWKAVNRNQALKKVFARSRFYYFKKHYGIVPALLVEIFCRFSLKSLFRFAGYHG